MKDQSKLDDDLKKALSSLNVEDRLPEDFEDRFLTEFKRRMLLESQVRPDTLKRYFDSHFTGFLNPLRVSIFGTAATIAIIAIAIFNNDSDQRRKNTGEPGKTPGVVESDKIDKPFAGNQQFNHEKWEQTMKELNTLINSILYFDPERASISEEP